MSVRDDQLAKLLAALTRVADAGERCPKNVVLAEMFGLQSPGHASELVSRLEKTGAIIVQRGARARVVTIAATGKRTAGAIPGPHWRDRPDEYAATRIKIAETNRRRDRAAAKVDAQPEILPPILERDPCARCGVRADIGCEHQVRSVERHLHDERIAA